jgi:hypothetical protein
MEVIINTMKKYLLFILLIFTVLFVQAQTKINQLDNKGNRHGVWKKFYSNDRIRYVGNFEHGKEVGIFKYYSASNSDNPILIKK